MQRLQWRSTWLPERRAHDRRSDNDNFNGGDVRGVRRCLIRTANTGGIMEMMTMEQALAEYECGYCGETVSGYHSCAAMREAETGRYEYDADEAMEEAA